MDGWVDDGWMDGWMDWWVDDWMDGWVGGWMMDGETDEWIKIMWSMHTLEDNSVNEEVGSSDTGCNMDGP